MIEKLRNRLQKDLNKGITIRQLALAMGMPYATMWRCCNGTYYGSLRTWERIANFYKIRYK